MKVRIAHDDHIRSSQERSEEIERLVRGHLSRFGELITSVQIHLSDDNGPRVTPDDRRCLIEARLAGREPIVVSHRADSLMQAVGGAASRLERAIDQSRDRRRHSRRQRARSVNPMPMRALVVERS
jgi:ribosome-associated translation inhibitor RaiA